MDSAHPPPFEYAAPATIDEVEQLLKTYGDVAKILAGGVDLIPRIRTGPIQASYVINIQNIPELKGFPSAAKAA